MGKRRTNECTVTPITRFFLGSDLATKSIEAGREIAVHDKNKNEPTMTASQRGIAMTTTKPTIAKRLNTSRARLMPKRSESHPPGKE